MRDYRIREEIKTSKDKQLVVSRFYPEYNAGFKWIPYWVPLARGCYGSAQYFMNIDLAKEAIQKDITKKNKKLIYSKDVMHYDTDTKTLNRLNKL